eukprot:scaffold2404_cov398-Prasinococcus_capsulatus_cf.AAC.18
MSLATGLWLVPSRCVSSATGVACARRGRVLHHYSTRSPRTVEVLAQDVSRQPRENKAGGIFGWVTNNKSSAEAVYLDDDELTASGGGAYVGQMIKSIGSRGEEGGKYMDVARNKWFVREKGSPSTSSAPPVLCLHGVLSQSYSYREMLDELSKVTFGG